MYQSSASTPTYDLMKWFLAPKLGSGTDLTAMRKCAETLRDNPVLLRSALNVLRHDDWGLRVISRRSSVHPNGFAKVILSCDDGWSLRLHVWSPWIQPEHHDVNPHGHRWAFASWIIVGILRETRFDVAHDGRPFRRYEYLGEYRLRTTRTGRAGP